MLLVVVALKEVGQDKNRAGAIRSWNVCTRESLTLVESSTGERARSTSRSREEEVASSRNSAR